MDPKDYIQRIGLREKYRKPSETRIFDGENYDFL